MPILRIEISEEIRVREGEKYYMWLLKTILNLSFEKRNAVILFYISLMGAFILSVLPSSPPGLEKVWDKANHALAFIVIAYLGFVAYRDSLVRLSLLVMLFGISIEVVQSFVPWREFSFLDMLADFIGILLGLILFFLVRMIREYLN